MRLLFLLCAAAAVFVLTLAGCNSTETKGNKASATASAPAPSSGHIAPADGVKRVTTVEARDAVNNGTAVIFDVRPASSYQQNHIKGSINIPVDQVEARVSEFPRDKMIITYCSWPAEHTSARAVQILKGKGIENAAALLGGTNAWSSAGLPMESGQ